jgi:hypothetical protein
MKNFKEKLLANPKVVSVSLAYTEAVEIIKVNGIPTVNLVVFQASGMEAKQPVTRN